MVYVVYCVWCVVYVYVYGTVYGFGDGAWCMVHGHHMCWIATLRTVYGAAEMWLRGL